MLIRQVKGAPYVNLSIDNCILEVKGDSYAEGLQDLYNEIIVWIENEIPNLNCELNCIFHFHTFSSVSMKNVIVILSKLNEHYKKGKKITIKWYYDKEDEDNMESAEDFTGFIDIPFEIIEV